MRRPPGPPLFPYTTLFRSSILAPGQEVISTDQSFDGTRGTAVDPIELHAARRIAQGDLPPVRRHDEFVGPARVRDGARSVRSEEHTSELQSHVNLVCRLLL